MANAADHVACGEEVWQDTAVMLDSATPETLWDWFTGRQVGAERGRLSVAETLRHFPFGILTSEKPRF